MSFLAGMKRLIWGVSLLFIFHSSLAQEKFTINGYIKDASNGEALIGATVYIKEIKGGASTNEYGFYSITLPPATYSIDYSYVSFGLISKTIALDKNTQISVELKPESEQLEEVVVQADLEQANVQNMEMSTNKLEIKTIFKVPTLFRRG